MSWQDLVFTVASVVFSLALLLSIFSVYKPPRSTCVLTAVPLWVFVPTYLSLGLLYSTITGAVTALLWTVLFVQGRETA